MLELFGSMGSKVGFVATRLNTRTGSQQSFAGPQTDEMGDLERAIYWGTRVRELSSRAPIWTLSLFASLNA